MSEEVKKSEVSEKSEVVSTAVPGTVDKAMKGRSPLGIRTGKRKDEWNRPNRKAAAKLAWRIRAFEREGNKSAGDHEMHRPGSLKIG